MSTYPGDPDAIVPLNSGGTTGGDFAVLDGPGGASLLRVRSTGPSIQLGADVTFPSTSGSPRREIVASDGLNLYSSSDGVRVGDGFRPCAVDYRSSTSDTTLQGEDNTAVIGTEVRLDGGQPYDPQEPTYGILARVRRNGQDPDQPQDRLIVEDSTAGVGSDGQVSIRTPSSTNGWDLELRAIDNSNNLKRVTLRGNADIIGDAEFAGTVTVDGATTVHGVLSVDNSITASGSVTAGDLVLEGPEPSVRLRDTSSSVEYSLQSAGALRLMRQAGADPAELLLEIQRSEDSSGLGTRFITRLLGPPSLSSPDTEEGVLEFGNRTTISCQDGPVELLAADGSVSVSPTDSAGLAQALVLAGSLTSGGSTQQAITLGATSSASVLRFGVVTAAGGGSGGGAYNVDDRFRVEGTGRMRVWDAASSGSPGTIAPILDLDPSSGDIILNVGSGTGAVGGNRGRVAARRGVATADPGLLELEADDGTRVFLSAWRSGGQVQLILSSVVPTSSASGIVVEQVPA